MVVALFYAVGLPIQRLARLFLLQLTIIEKGNKGDRRDSYQGELKAQFKTQDKLGK